MANLLIGATVLTMEDHDGSIRRVKLLLPGIPSLR